MKPKPAARRFDNCPIAVMVAPCACRGWEAAVAEPETETGPDPETETETELEAEQQHEPEPELEWSCFCFGAFFRAASVDLLS
eukprot:COSAG04_NODE_2346_length_4291_cov_35.546040_2_plen_83_part_00